MNEANNIIQELFGKDKTSTGGFCGISSNQPTFKMVSEFYLDGMMNYTNDLFIWIFIFLVVSIAKNNPYATFKMHHVRQWYLLIRQ